MTRTARRTSTAGALVALLAVALSGCGRTPAQPAGADERIGSAGADRLAAGDAGIGAGAAPRGRDPSAGPAGRNHAYFPLVPGRTADFSVRLVEGGERAMRITVGAPEEFFGRTAWPWVYSAIPGMLPDSSFRDLRQYFSVSPEGDLLFHGAQNKGFKSHTDPPIRILAAEPGDFAVWRDTVVFRSFLPGDVPFWTAREVHTTRLSARTALRLPAGTIHAYRSTQTITDAPPLRASWRAEPAGLAADGPAHAAAAAFEQRGVAAGGGRGGEPAVLKGFWFARQRGIVARDHPHGPGPTNTNIRTYELVRQGWGPLPPPCPCEGDGLPDA